MIECPTVGELTKILIGHNNKGSAPGWFLDRVFIEDMDENRIYEFPCERWLATDEDDGQVTRYLFPKKRKDGEREASEGRTPSLSLLYSPLLTPISLSRVLHRRRSVSRSSCFLML